MAIKLRKFDWEKPSEITTGDKTKYPWHLWFDGDIWQLEEGKDFFTHPLMMERIIRTRATLRKAKVRMRHVPHNGEQWGILVVQRRDVPGPAEQRRSSAQEKRAAKKAAAEADAAETLAKAGISPKISKRPAKRPAEAKRVA